MARDDAGERGLGHGQALRRKTDPPRLGDSQEPDQIVSLLEHGGGRYLRVLACCGHVSDLAARHRRARRQAGIESETLQRFLAWYNGVAEERMTKKGQKEMRAEFAKTAFVVDEVSLASTVQARDLLRIVDRKARTVMLEGKDGQL